MGFLTHLKSNIKGQNGSALVAVVIFSAAFIISGLAFFSLGGYEAGLFERRREAAQAFCYAESGVERARWVLDNTWSKSKAMADSVSMNVEAVEIDANGQVVRQGDDLIDFAHDVRVTSRGIEQGRERELQVVFTPGLDYAVGAAHHATFHGSANDGSWRDFFDRFNDVYIEGGLKYGHHVNGEDPHKYDEASQSDVSLPDYFKTLPSFRNHFQSMADTVYTTDKFFGKQGMNWHTVGDDQIIFVNGDVVINQNVDRWWNKSVDVTIIATGNITVNSGQNDGDDRLVLIARNNVTMKGAGFTNELNAVIFAGNEFRTKGYTSWTGGGGQLNGFVLANNVDMRGYDPFEAWPLKQGWEINQSIETLLMNGGIGVFQTDPGSIPLSLKQKNWAELAPEGEG